MISKYKCNKKGKFKKLDFKINEFSQAKLTMIWEFSNPVWSYIISDGTRFLALDCFPDVYENEIKRKEIEGILLNVAEANGIVFG